jgi:hypothetical protein
MAVNIFREKIVSKIFVFLFFQYSDTVNRRCCTSGCGEPGTVGDYEGRTAYFCGSDLCNGIGSEDELTTDGGK